MSKTRNQLYGNDVLPEANYAVLGRRCYSVREYLRVDKL